MNVIQRLSELTNNGYTPATAAKQVEEEFKIWAKKDARHETMARLGEYTTEDNQIEDTGDPELNSLLHWLHTLIPFGASVDTVINTFKTIKAPAHAPLDQDPNIEPEDKYAL